jgi:hypothetical protein
MINKYLKIGKEKVNRTNFNFKDLLPVTFASFSKACFLKFGAWHIVQKRNNSQE